MKDIHIGAHINTRSLVFTNPIAKYITVGQSVSECNVIYMQCWCEQILYHSLGHFVFFMWKTIHAKIVFLWLSAV